MQKHGPLRLTDFQNASFIFNHTALSIISRYNKDIRDRQAKTAPQPAADSQVHLPRTHATQPATQSRAPAPRDVGAPTPALQTSSAALVGAAPHSADAADGVLVGALQRNNSAAQFYDTGRRLARIKTRGANSASAVSTPATLHDCGTSAFDRQTPRETGRSRSQQHDAWVFCRSLAREASLAWPGLPDGSGCREPHLDIEGIRLKSARAYTCARAISDRMCTTYTAANSNMAWLPLVNSANSALLGSVLANAPCPAHGAGPSVLLSAHQQGKLQVQRRARDNPQGRPSAAAGMSTDVSSSLPLKASEKAVKAGKKSNTLEGKETRARAQEKLRIITEVQSSCAGEAEHSSPHKQQHDNLSQVAIRVFSLPNAGADAVHIAKRASHLGRSTGVAEVPYQVTQDLLFAPSRQKALPFMAELFSPVPLAQSWSQTAGYGLQPVVSEPDAGSQGLDEQDVELDSPDEAAMDTIRPDSANPPSHILMITPVVAPRQHRPQEHKRN